MSHVLIAGSNSKIGQSLAEKYRNEGYQVLTISRHPADHVGHLCCDLSQEDSLTKVHDWLAEQPPVDVCFSCFGLLHTDLIQPEKRLKSLSAANLSQLLNVNVMCHAHLAQAYEPFLKRDHRIHWLALSAMVGSIEDNRLGGWYSYRMTKAALNMLMRNIAIEWQRKSDTSVVCSIHPGTTDSALSAPFTANTAANKRYTAEQTANRLFTVEQSLTTAQHGKLLHWNGEILPF